MNIRLRCPNCIKIIAVPQTLAGKAGLCPYCQSKVRVPSLEEPEEPLEEVADAPPSIKTRDNPPPVRTRPTKQEDDEEIIEATDWEEDDEPKNRRDSRDDRVTTSRRGRSRRDDDDYDHDDRRRYRDEDDDYDRPRRRDDDDDDYDRPRKKRRRRRRKQPAIGAGLFDGMSPMMIALIVIAGISLISAGLAIVFPPMALVPIGLGWILSLVGGVMFLLVAFQDDAMQGLLCMFIPMYSLFYLITHFEEEKVPFFLQLGGTLLVILGYCAGGIGVGVWQSAGALQ